MEPAHYLQFTITILLIVTAAAVALICDVLKRNNQQLREMNIELKTRQEFRAPRPPKAEVKVEKKIPAPSLAAPKEHSITNLDRKRTVNPGALAAMNRGASLAASGPRPRSATVAHVPKVAPTVSVSAPKKDWGSLLSQNSQGREKLLPTGLQDAKVLSKLVQNRRPVSGLVVSIGVDASNGAVPSEISKLIQSLIGPNDFAAQSGKDEFLLIYPQERDASAQRKLTQIAQKLWDFQLRSLGVFQILFSWGGVEVRSESIEEAISSASERMQESKRGRKLLTMEAPAQEAGTAVRLQKAV